MSAPLCANATCDGECGLMRECNGRQTIDDVLHAGVSVPCSDFGTWGGEVKKGCDNCSAARRAEKELAVLVPRRAATAAIVARNVEILDLLREPSEKELLAAAIFGSSVFRECDEKDTLAILATTRSAYGTARAVAEANILKEWLMSMQVRGRKPNYA